jgi:hypothetical protein
MRKMPESEQETLARDQEEESKGNQRWAIFDCSAMMAGNPHEEDISNAGNRYD